MSLMTSSGRSGRKIVPLANFHVNHSIGSLYLTLLYVAIVVSCRGLDVEFM